MHTHINNLALLAHDFLPHRCEPCTAPIISWIGHSSSTLLSNGAPVQGLTQTQQTSCTSLSRFYLKEKSSLQHSLSPGLYLKHQIDHLKFFARERVIFTRHFFTKEPQDTENRNTFSFVFHTCLVISFSHFRFCWWLWPWKIDPIGLLNSLLHLLKVASIFPGHSFTHTSQVSNDYFLVPI